MAAADQGRGERKAQTRARILEAARELLLAEGAEGFSMRKLAARIGYTATAIYFHFPDKDALLVELVDQQFMTFRRAFDRFQGEPDPIQRLRKMGIGYLEFALRHPDHYRFMFLNPSLKSLPRGESIERGNPAEDGYAYLKTTLAEAIRAGLLRSEYHDADQAAQIIWAAVHGLAALHIVKGEDPWIDWCPPRPTVRLLVDAVLNGMLRTGSPRAVAGKPTARRRGAARPRKLVPSRPEAQP